MAGCEGGLAGEERWEVVVAGEEEGFCGTCRRWEGFRGSGRGDECSFRGGDRGFIV